MGIDRKRPSHIDNRIIFRIIWFNREETLDYMEREDEIVPYYSIQARQQKSRISCLTYRRADARYAASKPIARASANKDVVHTEKHTHHVRA